MKLTFIGTAPGVQSADRYCTCMMLEVGGSTYLIDAGAPICDIFPRMGRSISEIRALFNTHIHADHATGIYRMADLINGFYKQHEIDLYIPDREYSDLIIKLIEMASGHPGTKMDTDRVRFRTIDPTVPYEDENIKLSYFATGHIDKPFHSYAFLVEAEGKKIVFGGDLSKHLRDADIPAPVFEEEIDLFICEYAHIREEDIAPYMPKFKTKAVYFNHIPNEQKLAEVQAMNEKYPYLVYAPKDGDVVEI